MYRIVLVIFFTALFSILKAQQSQVIFTIDGQNITAGEFISDSHGLIKTEENWDFSQLIEKYADYRLQIYDAKKKKLDTLTSFHQADEYFENCLMIQHVFDSKTAQKYFKEEVARSEYQYLVSYIKISISANSKTDTLVAYKKIMSIKNRLSTGYSFSKLARQLSDDFNANFTGGDLGWVSPVDFFAGSEAENYIINHYDNDELSSPIRSGDYYYLIKTGGRRKAVSTVTISAIVKPKRYSWQYNDSIRKLFNNIKEEIKNGKSFSQLQSQYSDYPFKEETISLDQAYKKFSTKIYIKNNPTGLSNIIETPNFFCITKIIKESNGKRDVDYIKEKFIGSEKFKECYNAFMDSLKDKAGYKKLSDYRVLYKLFPDSAIYFGKWEPENLDRYNENLFEFNGKTYSVSDFAKYVYKTQGQDNYDKIENYLKGKYNEMTNSLVFQVADKVLKQNPDFNPKMQSFRNDELFRIYKEKQNLQKSARDTQKVYAYYKTLNAKLKTSHVLKISFYDYLTDKNRKKALKFAAEIYNDSNYVFKPEVMKHIKTGVYKLGENSDVDDIIKNFDSGKYTQENNGVTDIPKNHTIAVIKVQTFPVEYSAKEVFPIISPLYYRHLEEENIEQLRKKYNLKIQENALENIKKLFEK